MLLAFHDHSNDHLVLLKVAYPGGKWEVWGVGWNMVNHIKWHVIVRMKNIDANNFPKHSHAKVFPKHHPIIVVLVCLQHFWNLCLAKTFLTRHSCEKLRLAFCTFMRSGRLCVVRRHITLQLTLFPNPVSLLQKMRPETTQVCNPWCWLPFTNIVCHVSCDWCNLSTVTMCGHTLCSTILTIHSKSCLPLFHLWPTTYMSMQCVHTLVSILTCCSMFWVELMIIHA